MARYNTLTLNSAPVEFADFRPIEYKPITPDINILANSLAKIEERKEKAVEEEGNLDSALGVIEASLHNDETTRTWFNEYKKNIKKELNDVVNIGDYASAINIATKLAKNVPSDTQIISRLQANKEYTAKEDEVHKRALSEDISSDTEKWWKSTNPFEYEDKYNDNGEIIGGTSYEDMNVPVSDVDIPKLTEYAFKLITEYNNTDYEITGDGVISTQTRRITRQQIKENLNAILSGTPGAWSGMKQRYEVEKFKDKKAIENGENVNSSYRKNGSFMTEKDFYTEILYNTALSKNLAYENKASSISGIKTKEGDGSGKKGEEKPETTPTSTKSTDYETESKTGSTAKDSGTKAVDIMSN